MILVARIALGVVLGLFVLALLNSRGTRGCGVFLLLILGLVVWNVGC